MSMDWWRSWHGAPTDRKWRLVAKTTGRPVAEVVAVAWMLIDHASQHVTRGHADGFDCEAAADFLNADQAHIEAIIADLRSRGIIEGGRLAAWEKRQPTREDSTATERKRKQRQRDKESRDATVGERDNAGQSEMSRNVTQGHAHVTPVTALDTDTDKDTESPLPPKPSRSGPEKVRSAGADLGGGDSGFDDLVRQVFQIAGWPIAKRSPKHDAVIRAWADALPPEAILRVVQDGTASMQAEGQPPRHPSAFTARIEHEASHRATTAGTSQDRATWPLTHLDPGDPWTQADSDEHMRLHGRVPTRIASTGLTTADWLKRNERYATAGPVERQRQSLPPEYRPMTEPEMAAWVAESRASRIAQLQAAE